MTKLQLKNPDGTINAQIFSKDAEKWAKAVHESGARSKNKSSQLRKFYDEFFKLNQRSSAYSDKEWARVILPQVHMLVPKVVYAKGRNLITKEFEQFIRGLVNQIQTKQDLKLAVDFFEAFIGFYRVYGA